MHEIDMTVDELVSALLNLAPVENVCILDSCGARHLGSHLLIAGIEPVDLIEISGQNCEETLTVIEEKLSGELASVFTISYDFGLKLLNIPSQHALTETSSEPDMFIARFDVLIVHDYDSGKTTLTGNDRKFAAVADKLKTNISDLKFEISNSVPSVSSNFTKAAYLEAIEKIKERIRQGDTYQTNLTQQLTAHLPADLTPEIIFGKLRLDNPAPFSAFIKRLNSTVVSSSPERFFNLGGNPTVKNDVKIHTLSTSPIKGTRRRGRTPEEDNLLKQDLLASEKDHAENTMIVDLLRNDLGRVCEYGSVYVEKLCDLEAHPTLFHLVSTVSGEMRTDIKFSEILKAVFPCGSITGAPKISTMRIIDEIEPSKRGLSMGAIGYCVQSPKSRVPEDETTLDFGLWTLDKTYDLSVAIRTMVIKDQTAIFNVGGGIVIDSDPESEYRETLTKAKALLAAIGTSF